MIQLRPEEDFLDRSAAVALSLAQTSPAMGDVERRSKPSEAVVAIEEVLVVGQKSDARIEAGEKPSDPRRANARCLARLEPRDRGLRQTAPMGEPALAESAVRSELAQDLAEDVQRLLRRAVKPADRM